MSKWNQNDFESELIVDRGLKKWTAMMLPEHKVLLKEWDRSQNDILPPKRDEYEMGELAEQLSRAMIDTKTVSLTYWKDKRNYTIEGIIKRIDPIKRAVFVDIDEWDKRWIPAVSIVSIDGL